MFRKILYPTDFSDVSKNALNYLKQLKESGAEEILVLHVIDELYSGLLNMRYYSHKIHRR